MSDEMHCKKCQITFDRLSELEYIEPNQPCCPRCGSEELEVFRRDGKIVKI